jgi:hypothetical protein
MIVVHVKKFEPGLKHERGKILNKITRRDHHDLHYLYLRILVLTQFLSTFL